MYYGSIDQNVRRFIGGNSNVFEGQTVIVGSTGDFTLERVVRDVVLTPGEIYSQDSTLMALLMASANMGQDVPLDVADDDYKWLRPYLKESDPWAKLSAYLVFLSMLQWNKTDRVHHRRQWRGYMEQFKDLVEQTHDKLGEAGKVGITDYYNGDVLQHFSRFSFDRDAIFTLCVPIYRGRSGREHRIAEELLSWPKQESNRLDRERMKEIGEWLREGDRRYLVLTDEAWPDEEPAMVGQLKRGTPVYLYSNVVEERALFRRPVMDTGRRYKLVDADYRFHKKTEVSLVRIPPRDVLYYKSLFLGRNIDFAQAEHGIAVIVGGEGGGIAGFIEMSRSRPYITFWLDEVWCYGNKFWYMMADFPIEPKPHPKLSKLICALAKSVEMRRILERTRMEKSWGVLTTAWTEHSTSMKYRSVYDLVQRLKTPEGMQYLNYASWWKDESVAQIYRWWWNNHGKPAKNESEKGESDE